MTNLPTRPAMRLEQAAEFLGISKAHLSNIINGKVPGVRPIRTKRAGRRIIIKPEWIDEWLDGDEGTDRRRC